MLNSVYFAAVKDLASKPRTTTVTVFTRHSAECPRKDDPNWKRCGCRKSIYIYADGKVSYKSTKTRSWERAEQLAREERDARDPIKIKERELDERKAARDAAAISIADAAGRWQKSQKSNTHSSVKTYKTTVDKINRWAGRKHVTLLREVTPLLLDEWRGDWALDAKEKDDRLNGTSQMQFLTRLRSFFNWAVDHDLIEKSPARKLRSVRPEKERTWPLTKEQYEQLLNAADRYDDDRRREQDKFGRELKTIFQVQRWTGLRIIDVLKLSRSNLVGNRLRLITQKTGADFDRIIPDNVADALRSLPNRPGVHPDYFFWSADCANETLTKHWNDRIRRLRKLLSFKDDNGKPLEFHSQMLRDTFAVELLLAGVPLEDVSKLLTHESVRVTDKYYTRWVKSRMQQLDDKLVAAMRSMGATVTVCQRRSPAAMAEYETGTRSALVQPFPVLDKRGRYGRARAR